MRNKSALAIYSTHSNAEKAIKKLQLSGIDMKTLSIISKDTFTKENVVGYYSVGNRIAGWGKAGLFCGGIWGLVFGSAFLIPGIRPIMDGGPIVNWLVSALGTCLMVGGLSALGAALVSLGIPKNSMLKYKTEQEASGKFVLVTHDSPTAVQKAKSIIYCQNSTERMPTVHKELAAQHA